MSSDNLYYNSDPSLDDRVHVLVFVLSANATDIDVSHLQKMADVRKTASELGRWSAAGTCRALMGGGLIQTFLRKFIFYQSSPLRGCSYRK